MNFVEIWTSYGQRIVLNLHHVAYLMDSRILLNQPWGSDGELVSIEVDSATIRTLTEMINPRRIDYTGKEVSGSPQKDH